MSKDFVAVDQHLTAKKGAEALANICDDSTTEVTVPTPEGWKCEVKGCPTEFYHKHSTW